MRVEQPGAPWSVDGLPVRGQLNEERQCATKRHKVELAFQEAAERRRSDPEFKAKVRRIIERDRELLERLAR